MKTKAVYFSFIKYISPSCYFNLSNENRSLYLVDFNKLSEQEQSLIDYDDEYSTKGISILDAAYQAFQKGIIKTSKECQFHSTIEPNISDNYRFVKKYFHPFWVYYIFLIRVFSLKNPFTEIAGVLQSLKAKRINVYAKNSQNTHEVLHFQSPLVEANPEVSVIIPTLNRYQYLIDVLKDLENQTYKNFKVLVYDQSTPFNESFYENWNLDLTVVYQKEKALWLARNAAIQKSTGEYILLYDDDSLVEKDWIEQHLKCIDFYKADISSGVSLSVVGAKIPEQYYFFKWSDQVDTGNVMIRKNVFQTTGLFDRQFEKQRQGDGEWGMRAYLAGFKNISNPLAKRIHLKVPEGGLREMGSWDGFRPKKLFAPRPVPSVLYMTRKYFGWKAAVSSILINVPPSILPYKFKRSKAIMPIGLLISIFIFPIVFFTVVKSWRLSCKMIEEGAKIDILEQ